MAEDSGGDKSQDATPHRRQQAREEGHIAKSQDLASAALLLVGSIGLLSFGRGLAQAFSAFFTEQLGGEAWIKADQQFLVFQWHRTFAIFGKELLPIFGVLLFAGIAANIFQVGFLFLPEKLAPDITRLDPLQGIGRIFSLTNLMRLVMGLLKMTLVGVIAYVAVQSDRDRILSLAAMAVPQIAATLPGIILWTSIKIAVALFLLAVFDYAFQWWKNEQDLRMTTQEVREEMKNLEGNPQMTARRKQVQRQLAMSRVSAAVPKADVVVTNPTELAIAIQYDPETMAAPIVVAKGAGVIAQRIRKLALEHAVPILERKPLAQALYREVEVNHPVPQDKYAAVAEVLAYVYQLKGKKIPNPRKAV